MRKLFTTLLFILSFIAINSQAQTYVWNRTDSADFQVATNWTPDRTVPSATDVLSFENGATNTIAYNVPTQTIASLSVTNSTSIRLYSGAAITLTITGGANPVVLIGPGSTFAASSSAAGNAIVINIATGGTGLVAGNITMTSNSGSPAHRFQALDASAVTFTGVGSFTFGPLVSGNPFGTGTAPSGLNSMVFTSGSRYVARGGSNPFGAGQPNSACVFQSGSTFDCQITGPAFSGRTYANFELNNAGTVTGTGGAVCSINNITVNDGILNLNLTNRINIKGDISIAASKSLVFNSADSIHFVGTSQQSISGSGTLTFASATKVIMNNSNGLLLNRNVNLQGQLNMVSGNITTGANTLTLGSSTAILGTLVYTSGIIIGNFERWYAASTTPAPRLYPMGTATNYRPVTVSFPVTGPTTGGTIVVSHFDGGTDGSDLALPINDGGFNIERRSNMYWSLTAANGLLDGTYDLSVDGNGQTGINDATNLRLIYSGDAGTTFSAPGTHVTGLGTVASRTGITGGTYGQHYLGGNSTNNPLPVELDNFVATTIKNEVILDWATGHELNNSGFEIERAVLNPKQNRTDSDLNFQTVAFVPSKGNSNSVQGYKYIDGNLVVGRFAYRLKQMDYNGNHTYFLLNNEIVVTNPNKFTISQNYPNPFNPATTIAYDMPFSGTVKLVVFDNIGREVATLVNGNVNAGYYKVAFNASALPSGVYFYKVNATSGSEKFEKVFKMMLVK